MATCNTLDICDIVNLLETEWLNNQTQLVALSNGTALAASYTISGPDGSQHEDINGAKKIIYDRQAQIAKELNLLKPYQFTSRMR